jgi:two-component system cell cycle response regulator DivK
MLKPFVHLFVVKMKAITTKKVMGGLATVLYIEDNPDNRLLVRRVLQAEGYNVLEAGSAQQAMEIVLYGAPDLILMDINLPEIDGYTLTSQLKSIPSLSRVPIIALTANVMKGDRERTLNAGCDGYIQKPINVDMLPHQINRYLAVQRG